MIRYTYVVTPFHFVYVRMCCYQTVKINIRTLSYCARIKWRAQFDFCFWDICKRYERHKERKRERERLSSIANIYSKYLLFNWNSKGFYSNKRCKSVKCWPIIQTQSRNANTINTWRQIIEQHTHTHTHVICKYDAVLFSSWCL